jgi:hypothetical protein
VPRTAPARPFRSGRPRRCSPVPFRARFTPPVERLGMNGVGATAVAVRSHEERPELARSAPPRRRRGGVCVRLRPAKITARNSLRTRRLSRPGIRGRSRGDWCREWEQRSRLTEYYYKSGPKCITLASTERDRETAHSVDGARFQTPRPRDSPLFPVLRRPAAWSARREPAKRAQLHSRTRACITPPCDDGYALCRLLRATVSTNVLGVAFNAHCPSAFARWHP